MGGASASLNGGLRALLKVAGVALAVALVAFVVGWLLAIVRFTAARLPAVDSVEAMSLGQVLGHGALWTVEIVVVSAALGVVAWLAARRNWDTHGKTWQAIGTRGVARAAETRDATPPGDWPLQVVAGFNILIVAGLIAIAAGRIASLFVTKAYQTGADWLAVVVGVVVFAVAWFVLTKVGPLLKPGAHILVWLAVVLAALFASAPVGVLLLTGALVATAGRRIAKWQRPQTLAGFARSKVVWLVLAICGLLGVAYSAMGPVGLPRVVVGTPSGDLVGGYVGRAARASTSPPAPRSPTRPPPTRACGWSPPGRRLRAGRRWYGLSGHRGPAVARPPGIARDRHRAPTRRRCSTRRCARRSRPAPAPVRRPRPRVSPIRSWPRRGGGAGTAARPGARRRDARRAGRPPPAAMAALALRYQPTLLVTAADRNWPVSVNAVLAERGPTDQPVCLIRRAGRRARRSAIPPPRSSRPSRRLPPAARRRWAATGPRGQFRAFVAAVPGPGSATARLAGGSQLAGPVAVSPAVLLLRPRDPRTAFPKRALIPTASPAG